MSVRSAHPIDISDQIAANPGVMDSEAMELGEGATGFQASNRNHPLNRKVVVAVRATLAELSTNAGRAVWAPTPEALKGIYQQKQFTDLGGEAAAQGDLKSVVLHAVEARSVQSSFPIALGARITGVEEKFYSSVGAPFSMIVLPNQKGMAPVKLQEEDVSVAYDFAKETNGIHAVPARRFVLVAATHPLVTAIQENASALQTADITQMPEQLVKISSTLYDTLMPLVKEQVRSQIKVCDLSRMSVEIHPADFASWSAASESLTREAVAPIKAEQRRALKRADGDQTAVERINAEFAERIETEQAAVASTPLEIHLEVSTDYNFL